MLVLYINLKNRLYKTDQFETTARIRKIMINSCQLIYVLVLLTFFSRCSMQPVEVIDKEEDSVEPDNNGLYHIDDMIIDEYEFQEMYHSKSGHPDKRIDGQKEKCLMSKVIFIIECLGISIELHSIAL